jgi:hypothetical protein
VDIIPAVTRVRNMLVAASAIITPVDSFGVAVVVSPPAVWNRLSQVLINVIVHDNNTTTLPKHGKRKSASS